MADFQNLSLNILYIIYHVWRTREITGRRLPNIRQTDHPGPRVNIYNQFRLQTIANYFKVFDA